MLVRDLSKKKDEYKGRPTGAFDSECPCRPCWNAHDCGYHNSQGKWVTRMECATRWNHGCPDNRAPVHTTLPKGHKCQKCGSWTK